MRKRFVGGAVILAVLYLLGSNEKDATQRPGTDASSPPATKSGQANEQTPPSSVKLETSTPSASSSTGLLSSQEANTRQGSPVQFKAFIRGKAVALRNGPGKGFKILDRYDVGREVDVFGKEGEWARIRDRLTQREGWIFSSLLSEKQPDEPKKQTGPTREQKSAPPKAVPEISDGLIIQRLIAASIANYPGSCACPENRDRAGRKCGKRSAWSKGGGYAPLCYASDITPAMVSAFRGQ